MKEKSLGKLCLAEAFGTFFFVALGLSSVAVLVLGMSDINYPWMAVVWGVGITIAIYLVGNVSGAHMNPSVTLALTLFGGFDKKKAIPYMISQVVGAFLAAAVVYMLFSTRICDYEAANGWVRGMEDGSGAMGIFVTGPAEGLAMWKAFLAEVLMTAVLVITIFAVTDGENASAPQAGIGAVAIGTSVTLCGIASGPLTGFAMNPARDLGPRIFITLFGWGKYAWGANLYGLICPVLATFAGGILAGAFYTKVIKA